MTRSYRIGVAGAGIAGLAVASLLTDAGHDVTVFDRFDRPRPVGSGLLIQPVGQAVLDLIGAGADAMEHGARIHRMLGYETERGRPVLDVSYGAPGGDSFGLAIHRAALFQTLFDAASRRSVRFVSSVTITGHDGARLCSTTGQHGPFDLIVDAAGSGSPLSPLVSKPLPYGAVWGTVDWPDTPLPPDHLSQRYRRADRMIGALPIGTLPGSDGAKAAIFWSLPAGSHGDWLSHGLPAWKDEAIRLWPDFAPFLEQVSDPEQMTMARYSHGTLARPWSERIVHLGDAAHRASPQLGQGANMALLDALALTRAIDAHPLPDALRAYGLARRWHVRVYQAMSWAFTPQYQSDSRALPWLRDRILFPASRFPPVPHVLTRLVRGDLIPPLGSLATDRTVPSTPA